MMRRIALWSLLALLLVPVASCKKKPRLKETNDPRVLEARRLMAEAGYPEGANFPRVELLYNTDDSNKKIAAVLQAMWKEELGIDVDLVNNEWKVYLDKLSKLNYQAARRGWIGDYLDPNTFLELMTSKSGNNNTGWGPPEYDLLIESAGREPDPQKRMDLLMRAEKILMDEMPAIPIYFYVSQNMWKADVQGLYNNILNIHPIKEVVKGDGSGTLVLNNHAEIASLDPGISRGVPEHRVQLCVFEGLMNYDPKTGRAIPGVAHKYDLSADGLTYTFHLRDCVWSDGQPVTARDFEYAWKRVADPKTAADYAHIMSHIKGAAEFTEGKGPADAMAVRAKDDKTLVVELTHPTAYFIDLMPFFSFYPVRRDVLEKHGKEWTKPGNFVGNGPFKLKEWVTNEHLILEKNERYWDAGKVKQKTVKWLPTENKTTAFNQYEKGQCDYLDTVPLEFIEEILRRPDFHTDTYLGTYYISFHVKQKPFDDKRVRRALALVIDRNVICNEILKGGQKPALSFVPPNFEDKGYKSEPFVK